MKDRIKKVRRELDLTQQEFADRLGVKRGTVANYEVGRNEPVDSIISLICREFHVNENWLRYGDGEMFSSDPEDELQALTEKYGLTAADRILIEKFVNLKAESREAVLQFITDVAAALGSDGFYEDVPDSGEDLEKEVSPVGSEIESDVG